MTFGERTDTLGLKPLLTTRGFFAKDCPCGTGERYFGGYDGSRAGPRTQHANWHLEWDRGVRVPDSLYLDDSLLIVTGRSAMAERKLGYQLGRLFQREQGYDFPMAPSPSAWRGDLSEVLIAVWCGRAIGALFTYPTMRYGRWDVFDEKGMIPINVSVTEPHPKISGIWTANGRRRRGVATRLVGALSAYANLPTDEMIWALPFSDGGQALAVAMSGPSMRVC